MAEEIIRTTHLDEEDLARVDALAERQGCTRDEMLVVIVRAGLDEIEHEEAPPTTQRRLKRGAS